MPIRTESEKRHIKEQGKYESTLKRMRNTLVNNLDPIHVMSVEEQDEYLSLAGYIEGNFTNDGDKLLCAQSVKSSYEEHIQAGRYKKTFQGAYTTKQKLQIVTTNPTLTGKITADIYKNIKNNVFGPQHMVRMQSSLGSSAFPNGNFTKLRNTSRGAEGFLPCSAASTPYDRIERCIAIANAATDYFGCSLKANNLAFHMDPVKVITVLLQST